MRTRATWRTGLALALGLAGCGSGGADPPPVRPDSVRVPQDAASAIERLVALHATLTGPLAGGTELGRDRQRADELAIVARRLRELAAKSYPPDVVTRLGDRADEVGRESDKLGGLMRKGDAVQARVVHQAIGRLLERLRMDVPRPPKAE